jgi:hypothetical protein
MFLFSKEQHGLHGVYDSAFLFASDGILLFGFSNCFLMLKNVIIQWCKWNEAVSNGKCNISNTCATSYITADNSRLWCILY